MAGPTAQRSYRHPAAWVLDRVGPRSRRLGRYGELTEDSLLAGARGRSGLDNLGDDAVLEPLRVLLRSYRDEADLSFFGRLATRERCLLLLRQHLNVTELLARRPDISLRPIRRPTFITGLPRTGTTLLYRLLDQDPAYRAPRLWETLWSAPAGDRPGRDRRPLWGRLLAIATHRLAPGVRVVHPLGTRTPEEDLPLLMGSFRSLAFTLDAELPGYVRWLERQGSAAGLGTYRWHRRQLQVLDHGSAGRRWLLKSPAHLWDLESLRAVYPDARLILTHRDPLAVVPSTCSLYAVTRGLLSANVDLRRLGEWVLQQLREIASRAEAVRTSIPPQQLCDVAYQELVSSPLTAVRRIYRHFGDDLPQAVEERMTAWLAADRRARRPPHHYSAERFGLDPEVIRRRLSA